MDNIKKNMVLGILAHVDAGKTTLSEALLFETGAIRKAGRVDHGDAHLDTFDLEKERGITIFSKEARFETTHRSISLLDTPGHADFSPEMERTLRVLDCAVLVISAPDRVTGQVRTLWRLLRHYNVPTYIFVNKMDQPGMEADSILETLKTELSGGCIEFTGDDVPIPADFSNENVQEEIAVLDENLMTDYLEGNPIKSDVLPSLIHDQKLFPVFFGSALRMEGIRPLLNALDSLTTIPDYPSDFGARVYKISRDGNTRLSWMKITGGSLKIRDMINDEKVNQIRLNSGARSELIQEASAGMICAVAGLTTTHIGSGLGTETDDTTELLQPIESCRIILPEGADPVKSFADLRQLEEEEPMLHLSYNEETREITAEIMGEVQTEILRRLTLDRFGYPIDFGTPEIVYKETILNEVEGVGHFEPLRHYAEVHIMLTPSEPGSGVTFENKCPRDYLTVNFQRLIMTNLEEKAHRGVLTGSEITDIKITLIAGKSHEKHTEGGDFRQASYRAVRQGLMMAESVLLEPVLSFTLEVPSGNVGRAMTDISEMHGSTGAPEMSADGNRAVLTGTIPASELKDYSRTVAAYTAGEGHLSVQLKGYEPCHNTEEVLEKRGYMADLDTRNTGSSVFCIHGVGTIIPWDQVRSYMHIDTGWRPSDGSDADAAPSEFGENSFAAGDDTFYDRTEAHRAKQSGDRPDTRTFKEKERDRAAFDKELMDIFERTYGPIKKRVTNNDDDYPLVNSAEDTTTKGPQGGDSKYAAAVKKKNEPKKEYLLVDGYNMIFAWPELKSLASRDIKAARDRLMDILSNYAGFEKENVILVYDAYKVNGGQERIMRYHNIDVVFTREAETADLYIEKAAHELSKKYTVTVATSDNVEQVIIFGAGAYRLSALNFLEKIRNTENAISDLIGQ